MRRGTELLVVAAAVVAAGACSSSSKSTSSSSPAEVSTSAPGRSSSGSAPSGAQPVQVDLDISGSSNATIKGTKGKCELSQSGNAYVFEGADYPSLGANGVFQLTTDTRIGDTVEEPTIKLVVGKDGYITGSDTSGIHTNAERTVVNLDQNITSSTNGGAPRTIKVRGSIRCGDAAGS